jgi:hypothetical protein
MSRFLDAFEATVKHHDHILQGKLPNERFFRDLGVTEDDLGTEPVVALMLNIAAKWSARSTPMAAEVEMFMLGVAVGQKMEALRAEIPDSP